MEIVMRNYMTGNDIVLRDYQIRLLEKIKEHDHNLIITSRQMGMTTLLCYEAVINIINGKRVGYESYRMDTNRRFLEMVGEVLDNNGYNISIQKYEGCLGVDGGGSLYTKNIGQCDILLVDGVSVPTDTLFDKSVIVSRPYQSISDVIGSCDIKLNVEILKYDLVEFRDDDWRLEMIKNIGLKSFNKEYIS